MPSLDFGLLLYCNVHFAISLFCTREWREDLLPCIIDDLIVDLIIIECYITFEKTTKLSMKMINTIFDWETEIPITTK